MFVQLKLKKPIGDFHQWTFYFLFKLTNSQMTKSTIRNKIPNSIHSPIWTPQEFNQITHQLRLLQLRIQWKSLHKLIHSSFDIFYSAFRFMIHQ